MLAKNTILVRDRETCEVCTKPADIGLYDAKGAVRFYCASHLPP